MSLLKKITKKTIVLLLAVSLMLCLFGCDKAPDYEYDREFTDGSKIVFDLGVSTVTRGELLYFIAYYEMYGEYIRQQYSNMYNYTGMYWDEVIETENNTTESDYFKTLTRETTLYYEIFKNEALKAGLSLTAEELAGVKQSADASISTLSDEAVKQSGATVEGFYSMLKTQELGKKYVEKLRDEAKASEEYRITRDTYEESSDEDSEETLDDVLNAFVDSYVNSKFDEISSHYTITANDELWDSFRLGWVTIVR